MKNEAQAHHELKTILGDAYAPTWSVFCSLTSESDGMDGGVEHSIDQVCKLIAAFSTYDVEKVEKIRHLLLILASDDDCHDSDIADWCTLIHKIGDKMVFQDKHQRIFTISYVEMGDIAAAMSFWSTDIGQPTNGFDTIQTITFNTPVGAKQAIEECLKALNKILNA